MKIVDMIRTESYSTKWIIDNYNRVLLYIDDSFQRRYVWLEKHKIGLIETILMGYAIPEIYIWNIDLDTESGDFKYSIVDGQQRIGAVISYLNDEFALKKSILRVENRNKSFAGLKFSELSNSDKNLIWKYIFVFRVISDEVKKNDIVKIFLRLNSTDKSLNPQELRNAEYNGKFLETAIKISNFEFWSKYNIFSPENIRRMGDVEFISSLLIFLRFGIESEINQKAINYAYDIFEDKDDEAEEDMNLIFHILTIFEKIIEADESILDYIKKTTHFYTIFTLIFKCELHNKEFDMVLINKLCEFFRNYEKNDEYKKYVVEATRSKNSRMKRLEILSNYLGI